jgi:maleate isomerase
MKQSLSRLSPDPRHGDARLHVGVLVPWANSVVEAELPGWVQDKVVWHYSRLVPAPRSTALDDDFLQGLLGAVPAALGQLSALQLRAVYLACTSAAFMFPQQIRDVSSLTSHPIVTAFDSIVTTLRQQGISRIVLLTPYPRNVAETEANMLGRAGIRVTGYATLGLDDGYADVQPCQVDALVGEISDVAMREAEAIVLSCTGWPTYDLAGPLQRQFGVPVISSIQAIATHALSQGGAG